MKKIKLRQSNIKNGLLHNPKKILFENIIAHSTVMYRKELINKIGPYPKKYICSRLCFLS